jgi:hypothetical protein
MASLANEAIQMIDAAKHFINQIIHGDIPLPRLSR